MQGKKGALDPGEVLYNANEVEPHLALELTERLIRLSLESSTGDKMDGDEEMELDENGANIIADGVVHLYSCCCCRRRRCRC